MLEKKSPWFKLQAFPASPAWTSSFSLEARLFLQQDANLLDFSLWVTFKMTGPISDLALPLEKTDKTQLRNQKLWEHSCFELFAAPSKDPTSQPYLEWNFCSSKEWGHFRFDDYRVPSASNGDALPEAANLSETDSHLSYPSGISEIQFQKTASFAEMRARIDPKKITILQESLRQGNGARFSITAILENKKGEKSYWAVAHTQAQPDFHQLNSFVIQFP